MPLAVWPSKPLAAGASCASGLPLSSLMVRPVSVFTQARLGEKRPRQPPYGAVVLCVASGAPPKCMPQDGALGAESIQRPLMPAGCGSCAAAAAGAESVSEMPLPAQPASRHAMRTAPAAFAAVIRRGALLHGRDYELRTFLGAGRPARRDGLGLGVEADRVRSVLVEIAEAGALPAAERVVGERHRNGEIHAHHADLYAIDEVAGGVPVAGEDGDAVAVLVLGRQAHGLFVVLGADDREHRPEDLFLVDLHLGLHLIEQAGAHEVGLLLALPPEAAAVDQELGAFLDADIDVFLHPVERRLRDQWAVVGLRVGGGADL